MKALIIYGDSGAAEGAKAALQRSAQNVNCNVRWNLILWRVDLLRSSPAAEMALADASEAHLIVLAGPGAQSLPWWLQAWLERWAESRRQDAALAVFGAVVREQSLPVETFTLQNFAKWHGLSVVYDASEIEPEDQVPPVATPPEIHGSILPVMFRPRDDIGGGNGALDSGVSE